MQRPAATSANERPSRYFCRFRRSRFAELAVAGQTGASRGGRPDHIDGAGAGVPLSSPAPPSSSQVPVMLAKHVPDPQQLTPAAVPQAVSQSESTVHCAVHAPPSSPPPLGVVPDELPEVSSPLAPELLPEPELELFPLTDASAPVLAFTGAKPVELLFELPQAAMKPTAPRTVVRLRIEPIFIWRLPSAAPVFSVPHISVDELS
jgi:hypothetical protein